MKTSYSMEAIEVGVLGATGMVGERILGWLSDHPWLRLSEVGASERSAGRTLRDALADVGGSAPEEFGDLVLRSASDRWAAPIILSALPTGPALEAEAELARRGHLVVSNASAFRMDPQVPLIIPEVNPDHLDLLDRQRERWSGGIVTNPNCSVAALATALAPLHGAFGIRSVVATTLQAISGAGRPGPTAFDLTDNVIPHIPGEEAKLESEPCKILGELGDLGIEEASFAVSAQTTRVGVLHGHLVSVSVALIENPTLTEVHERLAGYQGKGDPGALPSSPSPIIEVIQGEARPQPRLDRDRGRGMTVTVGQIRPCPVQDVRFLVLAHNLDRGAAGAAVLNAELCLARQVVPGVGTP